ncbi:RagB/SusD family nutrient uptake outer membrane protein [Snuella lapsa]|uniref:RagB/SusD family nutrient uptake outer membrane protein n=1 Tax=Snuella lapsa TaxID=870481 RepID=A0ABP6XZ43_9FLAO
MKKIILVLISAFIAVSCDQDEFLDESPNKTSSTEITSIDDLDYLINGLGARSYSDQENIWCTDNTVIIQSILDETNSLPAEQIQHYTFSTDIDRTSDGKWSGHYYPILIANLALDLINSGELTGSDEVTKQALIAESHFIRANHLFQLAITHTLYPSTANEGELGLVLKQTPLLTESQERKTLKETFDFIVGEVEKAQNAYPANTPKKTIYRIDENSIHALAARIHLYLGDYDKAEASANAALAGYNTMVDYASNISTLSFSLWYGPYVYPTTAAFVPWNISIPEFFNDRYYYTYGTNSSWNTSPSQELMDLYEPTDVRNLFFIKDWFSRSGATTNLWYTYMQHYVGYASTGPSVPEMYLIRAECKARAGNISGAMADLEMVRINRFDVLDYAALPIPSTEKAAVNEIIDERRREYPFSLRFMDIKRLNNDPLTDPIIITRTINGETITIQPDDRRYARPIGNEVIILSDGATRQNEY